MTAPTLIIVSYYDRRSTERLEALLASLSRFQAGAPYDLLVVANRTSDSPLMPPGGVRVLERPNTGMNIGAWDHGWRHSPGYSSYLFLQDECFAVRDGWLAAFLERGADARIGLLGESSNPSWARPWPELRRLHAGEKLPDHTIDGKAAERVDVYLDFMRRHGVDPGENAQHLRSLIWFARRDVLEAIDGFPIGANYGECIAAEIAVSRKVIALGNSVEQVSDEPFRFIRHAEYNRDHPSAPFTHKRVDAAARQSLRAKEAALSPAGTDVVFRVATADPRLASTRYRALLPALGLGELGIRADVAAHGLDAATLRGLRALVFEKAFRPADLALAYEAKRAGVPIVLDLCDNIFLPEYGGGYGDLNAAVFTSMAQWAAAIVTTGPAMADVLRDMIPPGTRLDIIPDQVETPELVARLKQAPPQPSWRARAQFAARDPRAALRRIAQRLGGERPARVAATAAPAQANGVKTVIWFGNHGAEHSTFGMLSLVPVIPHLEAAARAHRLKLLIVSNSREKFEQNFAALPFPSEYRDWSLESIFADLDGADVCILPNAGDVFSLTKSANRVALALSRGVPVIAGDFPALADFRDCVVADDWAGGLRRYLGDDAAREADLARARDVIAKSYSAAAVARLWADLLGSISPRADKH